MIQAVTRDEEKILIKKAQKGDMAAFESLVKAHEGFVYNLALRTLGSDADAQDAAQDVFIKAWTSLASFRGESKLSVWLYRICGNVCTDMLRRRRNDTVSLTVDDGDGGDSELEIADSAPTPHEELEKRERSAALRKALDSLPEDYRRVLLLREAGDMSYDEIATALKLDIGTVKSRIFRARKKLCEILSADGNFFDNYPSKGRKGGEQV